MVPTKIVNMLNEAVNEFRKKSIAEISEKVYEISSPDTKRVKVTRRQVINALKLICPQTIEKLSDNLTNHFRNVRNYISFCSSPSSFRTAWDLRSKRINPWDANTILNQGGQLLPLNLNSRIFQYNQQGVELDANKRFVKAVRHSEGNYGDDLDDLGRFTYQPPNNTTGMLRYRWCQFLAEKLQIHFIILAVMWFKLHYQINNTLTHVFILAPVKIIDYANDLTNIGETLNHPLQLQLINRSEALENLNYISSLNEAELEYNIRYPLSEKLAREFAYDKIQISTKGKKGTQIKRWAQKTGKKRPDVSCKNSSPHIEFQDLTLSEIAFGHIISRKWTITFPHLSQIVNHPDNLYLTCRNCNSKLGDMFPNKTLRDEIERSGTIGDWIRGNIDEIKKINLKIKLPRSGK